MSKNLVIVESPAKAKTIEGYLGADYTVKSSFGHIRDLAKKGLSVEIDNEFIPNYEVSADKKPLVAELKKLAKNAECVWLATDEDREGEAISWHLFETLGLSHKNTHRITFNEITKTAVQKAIANPRKIDQDLVDAQQARRILDRIVGFELSPVLWRKVRPSLSAGRVQSVAVRLITEREAEIQSFLAESSFKTMTHLKAKNGSLQAELDHIFSEASAAESFLNEMKGRGLTVESIETKPTKRTPSAPFTTSTLQQEASVKLGFSVSRTMSVAQKLYEAGHITYMRTDSTNLSETALQGAAAEIISAFGPTYSNPSKYATKSASAQEAHEAIRPSNFGAVKVSDNRDEQKLYELIRKRTLASQMAHAKLEKTTVKLSGAPNSLTFTARGEVVIFDGFLKVYAASNLEEDEEEEGLLPKLEKGERIEVLDVLSTQRFTRSPSRYSEASLVKKMEELGIGRPSTYAPTISTIQKRGYVAKNESDGIQRKYVQFHLVGNELSKIDKTETVGADKNRLVPTDIGVLVTSFLEQQFSKIMDYQFTAQVEEAFDEIAQGKVKWNEMLKSFYSPFHATVEQTMETSARVTGERELGIDPKSGRKVIARMGKFGAMIQIGDEQTDGEKPAFASLMKNQSIATVSLKDALELFKLPRILGEFEGEVVKVNTGRFGPYVQLGKLFVSIPKDEDLMELPFERALELIQEKKTSAANNTLASFEERPDVLVLNGKYGPYLKIGKDNFKLPKGTEPSTLTLEECLQIAENQPSSKAKRSFKGKK
ncbi:MAG: type I DNA topoisomerase [Flavobacteriales bacterium]